MSTRYVAGLLLLLLALGSAWFLHRLEGDPAISVGDSGAPDLVMEGFRTVSLDLEGRPLHILSAERLRHFAATDINELERPHLIWYRPEGHPVEIVAEAGWIGPGREEGLLRGEVRILQRRPGGEPELELLTRNLRVHPAIQYAETDEAALIRSRGSESRGIGLQADLANGSLTLLSEVRTRYEPHSSP